MPIANDVDEARLKRLAALQDSHNTVLSLYLDLDPERFATPPARQSEADSLIDAAHREIESHERPHGELMALRGGLERARELLGDITVAAPEARAVAAFISLPLELDEMLRLEHPVALAAVVGDAPFLTPLSGQGTPEDLIVALVDERHARFLRGRDLGQRERAAIEDDVHGRQHQGGWSQPRYERSMEEDVRRHIVHVAAVLKETQRVDPFQLLMIACAQPLWNELVDALHPEVRSRLYEQRLALDVADAGIAEIEGAVAAALAERRAGHEDEVLAELRERLGRDEHPPRAVAGLPAVLEALVERRVEALLLDAGREEPGVRCPRDGWLGPAGIGTCPVDGGDVEIREDVVEDGVHMAIEQSAEVLVLEDRPDLGPLGGIAATLRF